MNTVLFKFRYSLLMLTAASILGGCTGPWINGFAAPPMGPPVRVTASGHGSVGNYAQYASGQQRLMATRAAQVDAYRNLAERVNGFAITGATTVSAFATQSDTVRSYVEAYIRGARLVGVTASSDGNYEATVELDITSQFMACMQTPANCIAPMPGREVETSVTPIASCSSAGCGTNSSAFVSY